MSLDRRVGRVSGYEGYLNNRSLSIAELLRDAGYHTYLSGKWHLGNGVPGRTDKKGKTPDQWGFDQSYAMLSACPMNHFGHEAAGSELYAKNGVYVLPPNDFYDSNYYTQQMIEFIDATRNQGDDGPFFAYVAYRTWMPTAARPPTSRRSTPTCSSRSSASGRRT